METRDLDTAAVEGALIEILDCAGQMDEEDAEAAGMWSADLFRDAFGPVHRQPVARWLRALIEREMEKETR